MEKETANKVFLPTITVFFALSHTILDIVEPAAYIDIDVYKNKFSNNFREKKLSLTLTVPRRYFFCGSFMFLFSLVFAMSLCASVYMCFVVTCWERADLLALVCGI